MNLAPDIAPISIAYTSEVVYYHYFFINYVDQIIFKLYAII